jgi:hypothetical protein
MRSDTTSKEARMSVARVTRSLTDPAAPPFERLLDPVAAAELIGAHRDAVHVRRLWYDPGRRLIAEYDVDGDGGVRTVVARSDRTLGTFPSVQWFPFDAALPLLALSADELAARLGLRPAEPERLAYTPFTRASIRVGAHVVKVYASSREYEAAADALERIDGVVRGPQLEYASPALRAVVRAFVPGLPADVFAAAPAAGELLRRLHRIDQQGLDYCLDRRLVQASRAAAVVEAVASELAARAHRVAARLEQFPPAYARLVTSHGDFKPSRLIRTTDGLALVDADDLCVNAPADDLAFYAAHAARGRPDDEAAVRLVLAALLSGYGDRPADLDGHVAAALLVRASWPFRTQTPDWRERTAHLLATAEAFA